MARKKKNLVVENEASEAAAENIETLNVDQDLETQTLDAAETQDPEDLEASTPEILESETEDTENSDIESDASIFLSEEEETEGFLPEASDQDVAEMEAAEEDGVSVEGTELDGFDSAEIEEVEFVEIERLESIVESVLFASDRPVSLASLKVLFKGTNVKGNHIRQALDQLAVEYAGGRRGVTLEEVPGGYQLRTKIDNMEFLKRTLKARQFKLSGPALEVLSIVAYKQPLVKNEVDEIRGVESGHLLRALMEKNLVCFEGKSELPGRPMQYGTTKKFLEIFGLRSLKELPTLSQIDELLPEGIDEVIAEEKPTLAAITDSMSEVVTNSYSQGEEELLKIQAQLEDIATSSNFFEEEKRRQAEKRDQERAQNIRDALASGEPVSTRDANWLKKHDEALAAGTTLVAIAAEKKAAFMGGVKKPETVAEADEMVAHATEVDPANTTDAELADAIEAFENDEDLEKASSDEELPYFGDAEDIDEDGKDAL